MSRSSDGIRLFHTVGPETEKARPPTFVLILTVTAALEVDDLSRSHKVYQVIVKKPKLTRPNVHRQSTPDKH